MATTTDTAVSTPIWRQQTFQELTDRTTGEIGRVVSSEKEPSGSHEFYFWAADDALTLDVGHIVVAFSEEAAVIGVVDEPRRFSDLRSFLDDYFDRHVELSMAEETPTQRPEILVFTVNVLATKHLRDDVQSRRPPVNGPVYFATNGAIEYALGVEMFSGNPIPALMHTNGNYEVAESGEVLTDDEDRPRFQRTPLYLDEEYLLGPEAGHANWTGQSGLATKTSHALFLTSSAFQTLSKGGKSVAALMFNVKGPDLLWLDKSAQPEDEHRDAYAEAGWKGLSGDDLDAYAALGLEPKPFEQLKVFAPFRPGMTPQPVNGAIQLGSFSDYASLNTARNAPGEADRVYPVLWSLEQALWYPHKIFSYGDLDDKLMGFIYELRDRKVKSLAQLEKTFDEIREYFEGDHGDYWNGHHKATIRKAENRFNGLKDKLGGLMGDGSVSYGSNPKETDQFGANELRVVDISACNTTAQELLVTSIINGVWKMAERGELGVDKLIVFVDELNKYAPAGGEGGLRDTLVDIAARGRHLNVVLLGAQQFRSKVDSEILGNCGTSLYGRIGDEEITNAAYRSISETAKAELLGLRKGRMLIRHAHFRAPLFGTFPHPPTIPGIYGQRVFGDSENQVTDPSDALFRTLQRLLGPKAPFKNEVLSETAGCTPEQIEEVRRKLDQTFRSGVNSHGNPWKLAVTQLRRLQDDSFTW